MACDSSGYKRQGADIRRGLRRLALGGDWRRHACRQQHNAHAAGEQFLLKVHELAEDLL
jgi:hypothetical protein